MRPPRRRTVVRPRRPRRSRSPPRVPRPTPTATPPVRLAARGAHAVPREHGRCHTSRRVASRLVSSEAAKPHRDRQCGGGAVGRHAGCARRVVADRELAGLAVQAHLCARCGGEAGRAEQAAFVCGGGGGGGTHMAMDAAKPPLILGLQVGAVAPPHHLHRQDMRSAADATRQ
eukprot:scaffold77509_cov75-Phaeocystis_antarctica.AAC.5